MLSARYGRNRDGYFWERYGGAGEIMRKVIRGLDVGLVVLVVRWSMC